MIVVARFVVESVTVPEGWECEMVTLRAVDKTDNPEDVSFADATPAGSLTMTITNKAVHGAFKVGDRFDVTLTPIP